MQKSFKFAFICLTFLFQSAIADNPLTPMQYVRGEPIFSSPYLGERSSFEAFDLIVAIPDQSQSIRLLEQMQKAENSLSSKGFTMPNQPTVDLSGRVEILANFEQSFGASKFNDSFDLVGAELDIFARVNSWAQAFFNIKYDDNALPKPVVANGVSLRKVDNSRFYLDQGFITFGNLNRFPLYFVAGQVHVPFGAVSTGLLSGTGTKLFLDVQQRSIMLGSKQEFGDFNYNLVVYGFDSTLKSNRNDGGAMLKVGYSKDKFSVKATGGAISNILEAKIFQEGSNNFKGLAMFTGSNTITARQVGFTYSGTLSFANFDLIYEDVFLSKSLLSTFFDNGVGGAIKPRAQHVELDGEFKVGRFPTLVTLSYDRTEDSHAFGRPEHKVAASVIIEPVKSTLFGVEFSRAKDYSSNVRSRSWGYASSTATTPSLTNLNPGTNKWKSQILVFFGYYF